MAAEREQEVRHGETKRDILPVSKLIHGHGVDPNNQFIWGNLTAQNAWEDQGPAGYERLGLLHAASSYSYWQQVF
ncbi:MAG: hypothetical protein P4L16_00005 [Chlamydiales bacterium]|nr:hypothetical protein [Chlamydiales bacterium]